MRVLFVCVGNSCRSQIAEALARKMGHDAASAGTKPAPEVSANALEILKEMGASTDGLYPKTIESLNLDRFEKIISMGCGVSCPNIKINEDWGLEDPVGSSLENFRETAKKILNLLRKSI